MLQYKWTSVTIKTNAEANTMLKLYKEHHPKVGATDTETNGLNIGLSTPFLLQFGWLHPVEMKGYTFAVDLERQPDLARKVAKAWLKLAEELNIHLGHNIKFDLHMLANIGLNYTVENLSDTMFYIRYGHNALQPANGGPPLGLKDYTTQFVDKNAKVFENKIKLEKSSIAKDLNQKLRKRITQWKLKDFQTFFKDPIADWTDLPEDIKPIYLEWLQNDVPIWLQPMVLGLVDPDTIPYNKLNRETVIEYAHFDIIYTLEVWASLDPVVSARHNMAGVEFENKLIFPLFEMERVGFKIDKPYLESARIAVKDYIKLQRQTLWDLVDQKLAVGQHAKIKQIMLDKFDTDAVSTGADQLDRLRADLISEGCEEEDIVLFIDLIQELRTLEKWYATYILRFQRDLLYTDRLWTQINQVGTVSGRVTSNFQQFPKKPINRKDGTELFHPRKIVLVTGGDYDALVYLDFSQIELRFQAFYTILVGNPDTNLCRAYMPYNCVDSNGVAFDYNNLEHIRAWENAWYLKEDPSILWTPTDVHGATTTEATGLTTEDGILYKTARSEIGKRVNFAKNYGAQRKKIRQMFPKATEDEVTRINDSYYKAFPGVKEYHTYCYDRAASHSFTTNLFGIRYYGASGHKLINLLVQGSAAYYLKWKIRQLYDYDKAHGTKTRWQMQIHDELSWEHHKDDPAELFFIYKTIMEDWPDTKVPIVAEMEASRTTWAAKKGMHNLNDLQICLST